MKILLSSGSLNPGIMLIIQMMKSVGQFQGNLIYLSPLPTNRIATIEAPENWKGTETITFTAQDTGGLTTSQTVTFSIIGAPDIADIPDQTVPEDTPFAPINLDDFVDDNNYSDSEINWSVTGQSALSISITNRVATIEAPENWNGTEALIFIAVVANVWVSGDSNWLVSWTST